MLLDIVLMVVCLGFSAFFSASETALTALDSVKTQKIIEKGGTFSKALRLWLDEPLKVLTCILIGNNIVNVAASALATDLARQGLAGSGYEETALPLAIGGMTLLLLTFGEITPKTIAKARSEDLAGRMIWALRIPYLLFFPITVAFTWLTRSLMKLGGEDLDDKTRHEVTEEDIEYLVELGSRGGQLEDRKERILQSVFEYTTTKVREIMIPRIEVVAVPETATSKTSSTW